MLKERQEMFELKRLKENNQQCLREKGISRKRDRHDLQEKTGRNVKTNERKKK